MQLFPLATRRGRSRAALRRPDAQPHLALVSTPAIAAGTGVRPVADTQAGIKFRAARDLRLRLRVAAATMEPAQDDILAVERAAWLDEHGSPP